MPIQTLSIIVAASWPWGPSGAELPDVIFGYSTLVLLISLIIWHNLTTPD